MLSCPSNFSGKNTGVGCHFLLQGIVPTQRLNRHLLHRQADSLPLGALINFIPKLLQRLTLLKTAPALGPCVLFSLQTISPLMHCIILTAPIGVTSEQEVVNPWIPRYDTGVLKWEISALRTLECGASIKFLVSEIATCLVILFEIIYKFLCLAPP